MTLALLSVILLLTQAGLAAAAEREPVREWFEPASGCDGWYEHISDDGVVQLVWVVGEGALLAADQRAEALGAEACTGWQEGSPFGGEDALSPENLPVPVSADLELQAKVVGEGEPAALQITVKITPLEELPASVNLRLLVTVDHSDGEGLDSHFVVHHYHWSSAFFREAGNLTDWEYTVDASRLAEDGVPFTDQDLWRLNVVALLVDDLDGSIHAATKTRVSTPSSVPSTGGAVLSVVVGVALLAGFAVVVLAERSREVGLPHVSGGLQMVKGEWRATVLVRAGKHGLVMKGASAEAPWRMVKGPRGHRLAAGEERTFRVRLRCSGDETSEAMTRWEVDVEELGGWVLDLRLPPRDKS